MSVEATTTPPQYAVYYSTAAGGFPAGYVWNRVLWDGSSAWAPPSGSVAIQDDAAVYPIGSTYTVSAS